MERSHETIRAHDDRTLWQLIAVLRDALEVLSRRVGLPNGSRGQVEHLVAVASNVGVEFGDAEVSPVSTDHREDVT